MPGDAIDHGIVPWRFGADGDDRRARRRYELTRARFVAGTHATHPLRCSRRRLTAGFRRRDRDAQRPIRERAPSTVGSRSAPLSCADASPHGDDSQSALDRVLARRGIDRSRCGLDAGSFFSTCSSRDRARGAWMLSMLLIERDLGGPTRIRPRSSDVNMLVMPGGREVRSRSIAVLSSRPGSATTNMAVATTGHAVIEADGER